MRGPNISYNDPKKPLRRPTPEAPETLPIGATFETFARESPGVGSLRDQRRPQKSSDVSETVSIKMERMYEGATLPPSEPSKFPPMDSVAVPMVPIAPPLTLVSPIMTSVAPPMTPIAPPMNSASSVLGWHRYRAASQLPDDSDDAVSLHADLPDIFAQSRPRAASKSLIQLPTARPTSPRLVVSEEVPETDPMVVALSEISGKVERLMSLADKLESEATKEDGGGLSSKQKNRVRRLQTLVKEALARVNFFETEGVSSH